MELSMSEPMSENTKLLLGHIFYRVKQMIRALVEDGDWPSIQMPSDDTIAQVLLNLSRDGYLSAAEMEDLALERLLEMPQDA